ncbi:MAG TPA: monovalent cation/H(+) antiporter subunit G, partial [Aggregatilineales bacterium]|nr:monovalent cation/H(+) antiporter subunit G [Aggregatilineales bacterium]
MSELPALPPWAAVTVSALVLIGSVFTLIGAIGLLRFRTFYERVHAPTIGSSFGVAGISLAGIVCFSVLRNGLALAFA